MPRQRLRMPQRQRMALKLIAERGVVAVRDLAEACGVSDMTIRRDLDALMEKNLIERTHGGAAALGFTEGAPVDLIEPEVTERTAHNLDCKLRIATLAAGLVEDDQTVALDIGSTAGCLADALADRPVNIYTSSLRIAMLLSGCRANIYVPPGRIDGVEPSIIGAQAVRHLVGLSFEIVFIGGSGLSERGLFDYSLEDSEVKQTLIANARRRIALLDSSKFNRCSIVRISDFSDIEMLITDAEPPENLRDALQAADVEIRVAR